MMIILNNLVSIFYDLRLIAFLTFFLTFIIFMDYKLQADPHKNKIENFKMLISKNTKRYIITIFMTNQNMIVRSSGSLMNLLFPQYTEVSPQKYEA